MTFFSPLSLSTCFHGLWLQNLHTTHKHTYTQTHLHTYTETETERREGRKEGKRKEAGKRARDRSERERNKENKNKRASERRGRRKKDRQTDRKRCSILHSTAPPLPSQVTTALLCGQGLNSGISCEVDSVSGLSLMIYGW